MGRVQALANALEANHPEYLKWYNGLQETYDTFMYYINGLGTLAELHRIVHNKKITKDDLNEYVTCMVAWNKRPQN